MGRVIPVDENGGSLKLGYCFARSLYLASDNCVLGCLKWMLSFSSLVHLCWPCVFAGLAGGITLGLVVLWRWLLPLLEYA